VFAMVNWTAGADCITSVVGSDSSIFLGGHQKEDVYAVPPRSVEDLVARLEAAVITVHVDMLRHARENIVWRTAGCPEIDGGCFEHLLCNC
jgi:hypothetical protein